MLRVLLEQAEITDFVAERGLQMCESVTHLKKTFLAYSTYRLSLVESVTHIAQLCSPTQLDSVNSDTLYSTQLSSTRLN